MNNQDKAISKLYTELYTNTHASFDFKNRVRTLTETKTHKKRISFRVVAILVAVVILTTIGSVIVTASRGVYKTVFFNGEAKTVRFGDFGNNTRIWGFDDGDTMYSVYVFGDFDIENETLYFVEKDDYILVSTIPEPTLNLYTDIDKSSNAAIKEVSGEKILCVTDDSGTQEIMLSYDEQDGVSDGKITHDENTVETYTILPNGSVANALKEKISWFGKIANRLGGGVFSGTQQGNTWDWEHFWGSFDGGNFWDNFSNQ